MHAPVPTPADRPAPDAPRAPTPAPTPAPAPPPLAGLSPDPARARQQSVARIVLAVALVALGLFILQGFLRALVWALILGIATWPLFRRLERWLPRDRHNITAPAVLTAVVTLVVVGPLSLLLVQLGHEGATVAAWVDDIRTHGAPLPDALSHLPILQDRVRDWWNANLGDPDAAQAMLDQVDRAQLLATGRTVGGKVVHGSVLFAFALVTLFFIYRDGRTLRAQMLVAANRFFGPHGETVGRQVVASVHGTVDGLVLVGLGTGLILGIGYVIAGVPHPALMGLVTAVGAMFPLGGTIALAVAALLLFANGGTVAAIILAAAGSAVIFAADHFVRPALIGGATRLPFLWVLLGILGGVETLGILGLFVGPATMAALIMLWREWVGDAPTPGSPPHTS